MVAPRLSPAYWRGGPEARTDARGGDHLRSREGKTPELLTGLAFREGERRSFASASLKDRDRAAKIGQLGRRECPSGRLHLFCATMGTLTPTLERQSLKWLLV